MKVLLYNQAYSAKTFIFPAAAEAMIHIGVYYLSILSVLIAGRCTDAQ
jgi:hypothetical protein